MKFPALFLSVALLVSPAPCLRAADYVKGYTIGLNSPLLTLTGGAGNTLFVDEASTGGNDLVADGGNPLWGWSFSGASSWAIGDTVEFTGIAMGFHADDPDSDGSGNTQNATHKINFYSAGPNDDFDGVTADSLIGFANVNFTSAGAGTDVYRVNFDSPVVWNSADSNRVYYHIVASGSNKAMRIQTGAAGAAAVIENRTNGNQMTVAGSTTTRLSVAGIVTPLNPLPTALEWTPGNGGDNASVYQEANWIDTDTGATAAADTVNPNTDINRSLIIRSGSPGGGAGAGGELRLGTGELTLNNATLRMNGSSGIDMGTIHPRLTIGDGKVLTNTISNGEVIMQGCSQLTLFDASPLANTTIDLQSPDCFVFFENRKPGTVIGNDIGKFRVNGGTATVGGNLQVIECYNGSMVRSKLSGGVAMKAFDGADLTGTKWNFTTGFKGNIGLGFAGYASGSGEYFVDGWGADIWDAADQCHFVYRSLSGDGEIVAKVDDVQDTHTFAKAGVMIRGDLTAGAPNALVFLRPDTKAFFQSRTVAGQETTATYGQGATDEIKWVKLVRQGNVFTATWSTDGTNWNAVGTSTTIDMPADVYIGLAATSHIGVERGTSKFNNVTVTGGGTPGTLGLFTDTRDIDSVWNVDNRISSFLLKRGYMAVVATDGGGQGTGKFYAATEADLLVNLPADLNDKVSYMRILPWRWMSKRGWGGSDGGMMSTINAYWNYEWEPTGASTDNREFVPMIKGRGQDKDFRWEEVRVRGRQTHFLGFNEPESANQGDLTVDEAIALWPKAQQLGLRLGSPARTDGNVGRDWLREFMQKAKANGYRVDFLCVHNYNRTNAAGLQSWLDAEHSYYENNGWPDLPISLTEFQRDTGDIPTAAQHESYLAGVIPMLEGLDYLERYAYYNFNTAPSGSNNASLFNGDGTANALGVIYGGSNSKPAYANLGQPAWATASITLPSGGSNQQQGSGQDLGITLSLDTSSISSVEFFSNGVSLGTDSTAPFQFAVDSIPPGSLTIHAVATTIFGERVVSGPVRVTVVAPDVEFGLLPPSPGPSGELTWTSIAGERYRVETSDALQDPWVFVDRIIAAGITESLTVPNYGADPKRFYRVVWEK